MTAYPTTLAHSATPITGSPGTLPRMATTSSTTCRPDAISSAWITPTSSLATAVRVCQQHRQSKPNDTDRLDNGIDRILPGERNRLALWRSLHQHQPDSRHAQRRNRPEHRHGYCSRQQPNWTMDQLHGTQRRNRRQQRPDHRLRLLQAHEHRQPRLPRQRRRQAAIPR